MKKNIFFIVFFLVLVSCKDTLIGGVEDINFDKSELYFDLMVEKRRLQQIMSRR